MTPVLFISYYFPPLGGAGVQRSTKFVRYLPDESFHPVVVAGPAEGRGRWEPTDLVLLAELPADLTVVRSEGRPERLGSGSRLERLVGGIQPLMRWWRDTLLRLGRQAVKEHQPDVIFVTLSPFESLEPALQLGHEFDLPIVADLRDPWALDEMQVFPSAWHRARERRQMGMQLARCAQVVMNTPEARRAALEAFPALEPDRVTCITNGYDGSDFEGLELRSPDGCFRIVHTGYLHTARALAHAQRGILKKLLRGERCPVDFRGRSHLCLLQALEQLEADLARRVELRLVGVLSPADQEAVQRSAARDCVRELGYLDHAASVRELVEADLLFLPMHALPAGERARIVPGKTYEYLASGRPVLAAVPEGDARDFVLAADAGDVVAPLDVAGMVDALRERITAAPEPRRPPGEEVQRFERRRLTGLLAEVLRAAL